MKDLFHRKPWLWIVLLLGFLMTLTLSFLVVAIRHRPEPAESHAGLSEWNDSPLARVAERGVDRGRWA